MADLLLTDTGDLDIQNGKVFLTDTLPQAVKQRTAIRLGTYRGEWFLDEDLGLPYLDHILMRSNNKRMLDSIIKSKIQQDPAIVHITDFESTIVNGQYFLRFNAKTLSGDLVNYTTSIN